VVKRSEEDLRRSLAAEKDRTTLRDLAARIGISHFAVYRFLDGQAVRPTTLERIRSWLDAPGEEDAVKELRKLLRRVLGRLGAARARDVEGAIGRAIADAFRGAGQEPPKWLKVFGRKQI